ncbi:MAG TPA: deoxyribodipyrimidine photo-lyase [Steroidobacteraceae bacterium]
MPITTLVWFRQDLRLADNPALAAALEFAAPIIPVFIFAPAEEGTWAPGAASRWWLHQSLSQLDAQLRKAGSRLCLRVAADSLTELLRLCRECGATRVLWNRRYEPTVIARDRRIKTELQAAGLETGSFNAALLHEPWSVMTGSGGPFQVFTPFWRHCTALPDPVEPSPAPARIAAPAAWPESRALGDLSLLPTLNWTQGLHAAWSPGNGAEVLRQFLDDSFDEYPSVRDRPDLPGTSRLSPYLHFGEIGPRQVWHAVRRFALNRGQHTSWRQSHFLTELGWREFAHHLLFHFPQTPEQPLREKFARFPWQSSALRLRAWQRGATGYPLIDAGMRQLWRTGWMHNRVRMISASFLVKDLLQPWTDGARWFWDTLVDADLASNTLGWQWVAGCGADAAPYFRIFNPITQATRFDPQGTYVREWVPELARLTSEWVHQPWAAPAEILADAGVRLGSSYPHRLVEHATARAAALAALATLKK